MANSPQNTPAAGSWRELVQVAWPLVVSSGSLSLMYVVDRMFLSWYSQDALAGSGPAGLLHWTIISLALGTAVYVNAFVAQYDGAGRPDRLAASLWQGVWFSLVAGALVIPLGPLAKGMFALIGHETGVQRQEVAYFVPLCYGTVPILLSATLACYFSGRGKTRAIMWVNLASAAIDGALNYVLIFGWGPVPALGAAGAAISTVVGSVASVAMYAVLMFRDANAASLAAHWRPDRELLGRLLRFGMPSGTHLLVDGLCFTLFIQIVGLVGSRELAATNLAFTLNTLVFVPILGLNTAIMTLTGQRIGEGRPELAVRTTWLAFAVAEAFTLGCAAVYLLAPSLILLPYRYRTDPVEFVVLSDQVIVLLRFVAVYSVFDAASIVFGAAIRGAGDTRFTLWFAAVTGVVLMVLPTWVAYRYFDGGLLSAWSAATVLIIVLGIGFYLRFQGGKWKSMRIIEGPVAPLPPLLTGEELVAVAPSEVE
jgi:MATE family multidrug resistance protein